MSHPDSPNPRLESARSARQAAEYAFPYHHLPHLAPGDRPRLGRNMRGGMEYLAYLDQVVDIVADLRPSSVLDVGCGDGRLLFELSSRVGTLVGIDLDARAVGHATAFSPGVDFRVQPVEELEGFFDVVTCVETLEHIPDASVHQFFVAAADRVAPGGHLVVTVPSTAREVLEKHFRHYDIPTLAAAVHLLPGDWDIDRLEEIVPCQPRLDECLRLVSNRYWTLDAPVLNRVVLRSLRRAVTPGKRGLHVLALLRRLA